MAVTTARRALPVWRIVWEAFASAPGNLPGLLRIFGAWTVIAGSAVYVMFQTLPSPGETPSSAFFMARLALFVAAFLAVPSTAVAWHRLILLGEQPPLIYLRVDGQVLGYLGRLLLISLAALPVLLICLLPLYFLASLLLPRILGVLLSAGKAPATMLFGLFDLVGLFIVLPALIVIARLSVSLPAVAVEQWFGFGAAWQLTEGNSLRLCVGTLLIYAPSYLFDRALEFLHPALRISLATYSLTILAILATVCVYSFCTVAALSFLSLSYRFFLPASLPGRPRAA